MKILLFWISILLLAFLAWPYTTVYRLNQALENNDHQAMERFIDMPSIREQIRRKMNKNLESTIGDVSGSFVDWLQNGIQRLGSDAIETMVTPEWAIAQLRSHNRDRHQGGFIDHLSYAFFDSPDSILLRIGELGDNPVHARLSLMGTDWRITAIYN